MVQPQAAVRGAEIGGAVTPPGEQLLGLGDSLAHQVREAAGLAQGRHGLDLDGRMADHLQHLTMAPDVVLPRGDVQVAGDDQGGGRVPEAGLGGQAGEEIQLVRELRVGLRVGSVAPRRDVEVLDLDPRDPGPDNPGMALAAEVQGGGVVEGKSRDDSHPVRALLAADAHVRVAGSLELGPGEFPFPALDLLEAQDVRVLLARETDHLLGAEADGVDVPGGESQAHGGFPVRPRKTRPEARAVRA